MVRNQEVGKNDRVVLTVPVDNTSAAALRDAINASAALAGLVTASASTNVVTVTAVATGAGGNSIGLAALGTGVAADHATLTGGGVGVAAAGTLTLSSVSGEIGGTIGGVDVTVLAGDCVDTAVTEIDETVEVQVSYQATTNSLVTIEDPDAGTTLARLGGAASGSIVGQKLSFRAKQLQTLRVRSDRKALDVLLTWKA